MDAEVTDPELMDTFYEKLVTLETLLEITDPGHFVPVPAHWIVLITDIRGSTQAIEKGRYKDINLIAASCIVALLNVAEKTEIPFVFGGDGASIVIPPELLPAAQQALAATQQLAAQAFQLDLRVGIIPVETILKANRSLSLTKLQVSPNFTQAVFRGGGLQYAEQLTKDPTMCHLYALPETGIIPQANYQGLECRWQDVLSQHGETVSLLIMALGSDEIVTSEVYKSTILAIDEIYGMSHTRRPVTEHSLRLTFKPAQLEKETQVRRWGYKSWQKCLYRIRIRLETLMGLVLMRIRFKFRSIDWSHQKETIIGATDFEKFDDMLRMVISGTLEQRLNLLRFLEVEFKAKRLVYGLHVSNRALMTCVVFERQGRQVHFIDGADGGYATAAKDMKRRLQSLSTPII